MKKVLIFAILAIVLTPATVNAQHDLSVWLNMRDGKTTVIPWYVYGGDDFFVDARYNFDAKDAGAVFIGKAFAIGEVTVIPAIGGIVGEYDSVSGEINLIGKIGKVSYFTLNQYSQGFGDSPNFAYHYLSLTYPVSNNVLVGIDEQCYWEKGYHGAWDIGPFLKLKSNDGLYLKAWLAATNTGSHKFMLGFGLTK